jgi:signal transduction histidine kinase
MRLKKVWEFLTGRPDNFETDNRIFNTISIFTLILLSLFVTANIILEFYELVALSILIWVIQLVFYYFSRVHKIYKFSFILYAIVSYIAVGATFFYNSGSNGPAIFVLFLTFHLLIAFTPRKTHKYWVVSHILVTLTLLTIEYLKPETAPYMYKTAKERYLDLSITYVFILAFIYFATIYLRNMLSREKGLTEKRSREIEGYNKQILEQNQKLEVLNQEKNKMFSVISHDLRSPLDSIQSYLELLSTDTLDAEQKHMIEKELASLTKNTSDMLANLLSWSKSQMEGVEVRLSAIDLSDTLAATLETQKLIANKKGVGLNYDINCDAQIMADRDMLQLVVRNLVNNAVKFTPSGGVVMVSCNNTGNDCRLMIKDNGIGISKEQQKELFSLKSKSTYGTMNEKGVGLGLLLCKEFVELQNGRIWFISSEGIGTTFFISLPLAAEEAVG